MTQKKLKLRKDRIIIAFAILIAIIVGIFGIIRDIKLKKTIEYKLTKIGYTEKETQTILDNTKNEESNIILKREYHKSIPNLLIQKYFMFDRLERYLAYIDKNEKEKISDVISIVNANADYNFYENIEKTDTSKNYSLIVNKHYELGKDYAPDDIVPCSTMYAYDNNSLREEAYNAFKRLFNAAKADGHTIIINSSYRTYDWQNEFYNDYKLTHGQSKADSIAARAGHSEHQSGLAIDVASFNNPSANFEDTEEFTWMSQNCYKYGFILRYPKGRENITGFEYESWHYRYVGIDIATEIHEKNITFEEYYEYYLK
ncbi:MAG: M15 family metallopeptidase [Bacilli bacterium]|nr:M15 family metallopeptidase [Bacilli bacterium]